jgi:hypothetical protein
MDHSFVWCWNLDTSKSRSEITWKFWNVLEKDGVDKLDWLCENEVLQNVKEKRNTLHTIKWWQTNWIGHILHSRCLLKHIIEGKVEGAGGGRRCEQVLDDLKKMKWCWELKEEALRCTLWRTCRKMEYVSMMCTYVISSLDPKFSQSDSTMWNKSQKYKIHNAKTL